MAPLLMAMTLVLLAQAVSGDPRLAVGRGEDAFFAAAAAQQEESDWQPDHLWPNRYWEALHGHNRCIPDFFGSCVPMELMSRICEWNRQADTGTWDTLGRDRLTALLRVSTDTPDYCEFRLKWPLFSIENRTKKWPFQSKFAVHLTFGVSPLL